MTSSRDQSERSSPSRPRLRLSVPTLNISRRASPLSASPRKEKEKAKAKVSSSGRGGMGNIRATKSQQFVKPGSLALQPSLSPATSSFSFSPQAISASESGSSAASLYSVQTGTDRRVSTSTTRSKFSWNRSTGNLLSNDAGTSGYNYTEETSSLLSSPRSSSLRSRPRESLFSTNSVNTFGIPRALKSNASDSLSSPTQGLSPTSTHYAKHLAADTAMRVEEKRLHTASGRTMGQAEGPRTGPVEKVRTGRGGAGVYMKVNKDIDPGLFPTTAALTREHDLRLAAQEKQIVEASRVKSAAVRRTGRGGLGNVSTRKGRERQEKLRLSGANRKSDSELSKMSAREKGKRRRGSTAFEDRENDEEHAKSSVRSHRRSGSASSHTGSVYKRRSLRSKSTVQARKKGINRLWSTVANIGAKNSRTKGNGSTEFEIVELRPSTDHVVEHAGPPSSESAALSCIMSASTAASANRALALARLERGSRKIQLGEVPEEDAWVDDESQDASASPIIPREDLQRYLQSLPSSRTNMENYPPNPNDERRIQTSIDCRGNSKNAVWRRTLVNAERGANVPRDSVGTFGRSKNSVVYEKDDDDDAESILDPYMRSP